MLNPPTVVVELKKSERLWPVRRTQKWYFIAYNKQAPDKTQVRSSETYTNRQDCLDVINTHYGADTKALVLDEDGHYLTARTPAATIGNTTPSRRRRKAAK